MTAILDLTPPLGFEDDFIVLLPGFSDIPKFMLKYMPMPVPFLVPEPVPDVTPVPIYIPDTTDVLVPVHMLFPVFTTAPAPLTASTAVPTSARGPASMSAPVSVSMRLQFQNPCLSWHQLWPLLSSHRLGHHQFLSLIQFPAQTQSFHISLSPYSDQWSVLGCPRLHFSLPVQATWKRTALPQSKVAPWGRVGLLCNSSPDVQKYVYCVHIRQESDLKQRIKQDIMVKSRYRRGHLKQQKLLLLTNQQGVQTCAYLLSAYFSEYWF